MTQVCQFMNQTCGRLLTTGFLSVERHHSGCLKKVKAQLPRRESERRNHPLARHCDILSAIETRLSLLGMTFMKYIDLKLCCFIPGKVIDEIFKLLRIVESSQNICRVHDLLQELRDISSMAMEHFEERVAPRLRTQMNSRNPALAAFATAGKITMRGIPGQGALFSYKSTFRSPAAGDDLTGLQQTVKQVSDLQRKEINELKNTVRQLQQTVKEQGTQIAEHRERIRLLEDSRLVAVEGARVAKRDSPTAAQLQEPREQLPPVASRTRSKRQVLAVHATEPEFKRRTKE